MRERERERETVINSLIYRHILMKSSGLVFTKGLRLSQVLGLGLKSSVKVKTFVLAKFCLKTVFTKGDLAKSKIIK